MCVSAVFAAERSRINKLYFYEQSISEVIVNAQ